MYTMQLVLSLGGYVNILGAVLIDSSQQQGICRAGVRQQAAIGWISSWPEKTVEPTLVVCNCQLGGSLVFITICL